MNKKRYKVIIRGGYGLTNFGDDALLKSLHEDYFSNYSNVELAYSCTNTEYLKKYIPEYEILPLNVDYSELSDVLIYGGGTQFYSFEKNGIKEKFLNNLQLLKNPVELINKILIVLSRRFNKVDTNSAQIKKMALGIGVGPFLPTADYRVEDGVRRLFKNMEFVAVRDIYSLNKCKDWGIENYNLYADICFKMTHPFFFKQNTKKTINDLGIIVRDWKRTKEGGSYREGLMEFINKIKDDNINIHFFVFAKDSDTDWIKFLNQNGHKYHLWNPESDEFDDYLKKLYAMDAFVTARYHGAIFGSMLGKPFITIEVEQKLRMVSELFSNGSRNWAYPFDPVDLYNQYLKIKMEYVNHSLAVSHVAKEQRNLAFKMCDDLQEKLKN